MRALVINASISASWLFDDEDDPQADTALSALEDHAGLVPQLCKRCAAPLLPPAL